MKEIFKIFKVNVQEADRIAGIVNTPHQHDFEELIIGREGQLEHFIDYESQTIDAPFVSFVTQGKVHRVRPLAKNGACNMWVIRFKSEFITQTTFQLYASFHNNANMYLQHTECFERLDIICDLIYREYIQEAPDLPVIRQLLSALLTMVESEKRKQADNHNESQRVQNATFKNFLALLEENYHKPEGVGFYAEKLFMSTRNLNLICQEMLHQSVSEIIETRKLTEAKNLLITTGKTVAEIGYELGYKEKTYFTKVFRKKAGVTPTDFRAEMFKLIS